MASRIDLHNELCTLLGSRNVYFQPPETIKMSYPCIVYSRDDVATEHADDRIYKHRNRYEITVIDSDPDSKTPDMIMLHFMMCRFDRSFVTDNLNHTTLILYY